jgi:hypothetical protein
MIRKVVTGVIIAGIGYLVGLVVGYRSAVVDYVENDARTIRSVAQKMYDTRTVRELAKEDLSDEEMEKLPEQVQRYLKQKQDGESERRGFQ